MNLTKNQIQAVRNQVSRLGIASVTAEQIQKEAQAHESFDSTAIAVSLTQKLETQLTTMTDNTLRRRNDEAKDNQESALDKLTPGGIKSLILSSSADLSVVLTDVQIEEISKNFVSLASNISSDIEAYEEFVSLLKGYLLKVKLAYENSVSRLNTELKDEVNDFYNVIRDNNTRSQQNLSSISEEIQAVQTDYKSRSGQFRNVLQKAKTLLNQS